jgi:hypothetical protein
MLVTFIAFLPVPGVENKPNTQNKWQTGGTSGYECPLKFVNTSLSNFIGVQRPRKSHSNLAFPFSRLRR